MKRRISASLAMAGLSVLLLTSCVSSKKYKASQAALAQARTDSAQLAQQVASLNQNIQTMDQKTKDLQQNLDKTTASYTSTQQSLGYYQTYFDKQQADANAVNTELTSAMTAAGITDADMTAANGTVTINLDENNIFKANSAVVSTKGKQVLDGIATVIKNHQDKMNVTVDNGEDGAIASGTTTSTSTDNSSSMDNSSASSSASSSSSVDNGATPRRSTATANRAARPRAAATKSSVARKTPRKVSGESRSMTYSNKGTAKTSKSWALKTGRVNSITNSLLKSGVSKVNVVHMQQPAGATGTSNNKIRVVLSPVMKDFTPPASTSTTTTSGNN
ncbi:MAG: hypothetical protein H7Y27_16095 [Gemmatimonadaceae bacterium]|nr:hypothetical protein [Chitinophagaceae bacterium]